MPKIFSYLNVKFFWGKRQTVSSNVVTVIFILQWHEQGIFLMLSIQSV